MSFQNAADRDRKPRAFSNETPDDSMNSDRPSRQQAEDAVRTLISWLGDDPDRHELRQTPQRVIKAYEEFFAGYHVDLNKFRWTLEDASGYQDMVLQTNIDFESHCQHHMLPMIGKVHIAYFPDQSIAGLSKLARIVNVFAKRLQNQERLTREICDAIHGALEPRGVAISIAAQHLCISSRGAHKPNTTTHTYHYCGIFTEQPYLCERFTRLLPKSL